MPFATVEERRAYQNAFYKRADQQHRRALDARRYRYRRKRRIFERDAYTCYYCGMRKPYGELEVDHMRPRARGGPDVDANRITACRECNREKGTRDAASFRLLKQTGAPF